MTSESKILTVSYGTFSCTLEGFDDPFDTMKAIAEYFRDLAAQDRHFGAEPPPPDAAMLHRLAEREVSRLAVAAAQRDEAAQAEPAVSPRIQFNPVGRRTARGTVEPDPLAQDATVAPEPSLQDVIPDGVAAKLARIRRAVHPASTPLVDQTELGADLSERDVEPLATTVAAPEADAEPGAIADTISLADVHVADTPDVAARLGALIAGDATPMTDEIADNPAAPVVDVWTDTDAADFVAIAEDDGDVAAPLAGDVVRADDLAADPAFDAPLPADLETLVAKDATLAGDAAPEDAQDAAAEDLADLAALDGVTFDEAALEAALHDPLPDAGPHLAALEGADATLASVSHPDELAESVAAEFGAAEFVTEDAAEPVAFADAEDAAELLPAAEVVDPLAADEIAAAAPELMPEPMPEPIIDDADDDDVEPPAPVRAAGRSRRMNSRVIRLHPDEETPASLRDSVATRILSTPHEGDEVARLMQQAEEVMAEDENRRRQEALSRLKAAVASTEADRADLDYQPPRADVNLDPYRDDLAEAIQPDEPEVPASPPEVKPRRQSVPLRTQDQPRPGTIRPGMISPPPLVLVSEQRVDRVSPAAPSAPPAAPMVSPAVPGIAPANPDAAPMVALRTGRLSGAIGAGAALATATAPARNIVLEKPSYGPATDAEDDEDLAEDSREIDEQGLAAFAETVGATSMAEMLEAAAAYATCVEKREQFTRPQLMRRMMASAGGKPVSREDGLRSFGTLLRTGRIEKVTRGHYALADNSPYLAEARRLS